SAVESHAVPSPRPGPTLPASQERRERPGTMACARREPGREKSFRARESVRPDLCEGDAMRFRTGILVSVLVQLALVPAARGQLVQVREDFSRDPGWDRFQNRIVGTDMPQVVQDLGWRRTNHTGRGPGEIGG